MPNLANLQDLVNRDPAAYKEDCIVLYRHFQSEFQIFKKKKASYSKIFAQQIGFFSQVMPYYALELQEFPTLLFDYLETNFTVIHPAMRATMVKALILLRLRGVISAPSLIRLFFKLFRCPDKKLRSFMYKNIVNDICSLHKESKNTPLNRSIQNYIFSMLQDEYNIAARKAMQILIELYYRNIWCDSKSVGVIATGCFSKDAKTIVSSLKFFLSCKRRKTDDDEDASASSDDGSRKEAEAQSFLDKLQKKQNIRKKTRKKQSQLAKAKDKLDFVRRTKKMTDANFSAIERLNDPQGLGEKLFSTLKTCTEKFEIRMLYMNFISRIVAVHKILLINFYPFIQKYLNPKQRNVTYLLAVVAQAAHDAIPDDVLSPVVRCIANQFVNDHSPPEVMAVGLNTIRAICNRCPHALDETLLLDLVQYKSFKDSNVSSAAKGLVNLYRYFDPKKLPRKNRGKFHLLVPKPLAYGEARPAEFVDGVDLLELDEQMKLALGDKYDPSDVFGSTQVNDEVDANLELILQEDPTNQLKHENGSDGDESDDDSNLSDLSELSDLSDFNLDELSDLSEDEEQSSTSTNNKKELDEKTKKKSINNKKDDEEQANTKEALNEKAVDSQSQKQEMTSATNESLSKKRKLHIDAYRILGPEDFERIKELKLQKVHDPRAHKNMLKQAARYGLQDEVKALDKTISLPEDEIVEASDLTAGVKRKATSAEKLRHVLASREIKSSYSTTKKLNRQEKNEKTNREKSKLQPMALIKNSKRVKRKQQRSFRDSQLKRGKHLKSVNKFKLKKRL